MGNKKITLTPTEFILTLVTGMVGVGILYIPNGLIKYANQDAWVACIFGAAYPFYIVFIAKYLSSKAPNDNILVLSKKLFGRFFGNILNIIFVSFFLFILSSEVAGFSNAFKTYVTSFLKDYQIIVVSCLAAAYAVANGIKPLARLNVVVFFITAELMFLPSGALINGSILNIMPVFRSGIVRILQASRETTFFYTGIETILLIYPLLNKKDKIFKYGTIGVSFVMVLYVWTVFLTIYYLGIDISPKYLWPILALTDAINIPIINSFRYIFLSLWALIIIKCIAMFYYSTVYGITQVVTKFQIKPVTIFLYPIIVYLSLSFGNALERSEISGKITPIYVVYILIYVTVIALVLKLKRGDVNEEK
ncbi:hypothetical protein CSC2_18390 [Clostridium zeae]|uniref:Spore germination protein n=1 Tax=Clostridium zeae TaxID=2759022 RepID=A0ABQ1E967_9CLOT|nr:GerAB/ArcD/ProY family transporter [Clostridium zeae]GFZ31313.1 hypothetical protein CSC2_18390 [Clostridium zeae]